MSWRRIAVVVLIVVGAGLWILFRPSTHPGEAALDLSVYTDTAREARPVAGAPAQLRGDPRG
jgi:hypothetical protein